MTKKIVLVLVEGPTDEDALALVFEKLLKEHEIEFDVLHTDITAKEEMTSKIWAKNRDRLIRRNISKRQIVYQLAHMERLPESHLYEIYYFSRNMEHVLHNISEDLSDDEKEDLAFETAMRYREKPEDFLHFLKTGEFFVPGTYVDTWKFIMEDGNSLRRYCNLSVFFEQLL